MDGIPLSHAIVTVSIFMIVLSLASLVARDARAANSGIFDKPVTGLVSLGSRGTIF